MREEQVWMPLLPLYIAWSGEGFYKNIEQGSLLHVNKISLQRKNITRTDIIYFVFVIKFQPIIWCYELSKN